MAGPVVRSVLGPGVVVEEGAEGRGSVLLDNTVLKAGAVVAGTICDTGVSIGAGASVGRRPAAGRELGAEDLVIVGGGVEVPPGRDVGTGSRLATPTPTG